MWDHGVSFHHAGLSLNDRRTVEKAFLEEQISVLCSTSTLATGINLPAFCVIIRGTKKYEDGGWKDASDLDIIQMMGRAGRPQFDTRGVAVIMCEQERQEHYLQLVHGSCDVESRLGHELKEHMNAEIGLKGSCRTEYVQRWLESTFFFVRLQKDPSRFQLIGDLEMTGGGSSSIVKSVCSQSLQALIDHRLVTRLTDGIQSTTAGKIMYRFNLQYDTMLSLMKLEEKAGVRQILEVISSAAEFSDLRLRQGEKSFLSKLLGHPEIRFPPKTVKGVPDKISLLIQATLACINLREVGQGPGSQSNLGLEVYTIFRHAPRICKAINDLACDKQDGTIVKASFELLRSLYGKAWDFSPWVLRQLNGVGEKSIKVLAAGGICSIEDVVTSRPHRIELLLNRNPPFGSRMIQSALELPRFFLHVQQVSAMNATSATKWPQILIDVTVGLKDSTKVAFKSEITKQLLGVCVLCLSSELDFIDFRRMPLKKLQSDKPFRLIFPLRKPGHRIVVLAACEEVVGTLVKAELHPDVSGIVFPDHAAVSFVLVI